MNLKPRYEHCNCSRTQQQLPRTFLYFIGHHTHGQNSEGDLTIKLQNTPVKMSTCNWKNSTTGIKVTIDNSEFTK